jgi:hypothetical protein
MSIRAAVTGEKKRLRRGRGASPPGGEAVCIETETVSQGQSPPGHSRSNALSRRRHPTLDRCIKRPPPANRMTIKSACRKGLAPAGVDLPANSPRQSSLVKPKKSGFFGSSCAVRAQRGRHLQRPACRAIPRDSSRIREDNDSSKAFVLPCQGRCRSPQLRPQLRSLASVPFATNGFSIANAAAKPRRLPIGASRLKIHLKIVSEDYGAI